MFLESFPTFLGRKGVLNGSDKKESLLFFSKCSRGNQSCIRCRRPLKDRGGYYFQFLSRGQNRQTSCNHKLAGSTHFLTIHSQELARFRMNLAEFTDKLPPVFGPGDPPRFALPLRLGTGPCFLA